MSQAGSPARSAGSQPQRGGSPPLLVGPLIPPLGAEMGYPGGMVRQASPSTVYEAPVRDYQLALETASRAPMPARTGKVDCATAGWTDPTLLRGARFYPRAVKTARDRLAFYAQHFPFVEVDATYYALLPAAQAAQWLAYTPPSFTFDIKAHPVLTGQPFEVERLPPSLRQELEHSGVSGRVYAERLPPAITRSIEDLFADFLQPLLAAQRLGCLLLQFPPWFGRSAANVRRLEELAERWARVPMAAEFRHPSWLGAEQERSSLALLAKCGLSLVLVDAPEEMQLGEKALSVTNPRLAVVRFHGRNQAGWSKKASSVHERFSYLYSADELRPWTVRLRELAGRAEKVHATFNNCYRDYAVLNAKEMAALLLEDDPAPGDEPEPE